VAARSGVRVALRLFAPFSLAMASAATAIVADSSTTAVARLAARLPTRLAVAAVGIDV